MHAVIELEARSPVLPRFPSYGICILESRHTGEFKMQPSRYDFSEVMLVLGGEGWIVQGGIHHPLKRHDLMVVPTGSSYFMVDRSEDPLAVLCLCVCPPVEHTKLWDPVLPEQFAVHRSSPLAGEIASHLRSILFEQSCPKICTETMVIAQTMMLLSKLKRNAGGAAGMRPREVELLARVQDYVSQLAGSFHESETIETVASRLGISPKSLTTHFRTLTGLSRHRYIQNLRLEHACLLLTESSQSVTSISFACGFEDLSTFFRAFRLGKKMSPSQWRNRGTSG